MIDLKGYKVNSISIENNAKNGTELKLQNKINYHVNYIEADQKCLGVLTFKIEDANGVDFEIKIDLIAEFTYSNEDDKATIHTESFDSIFPYLRAMITNLTAMAGMPGLVIPTVRLNKESVSFAENKKEESPLN